jgi:hypothetical protein
VSAPTDVARSSAADTPKRGFSIPGWAICATGVVLALLYGVLVADLHAGAALVMIGLGGLAAGLCGLALFRVVDPLLRPAAAAARAEANRQSVRLRELEREKGLVLKAIREIEHDFQMRKISESDYQKMSHRYRARAMRLIQEIDAGDDFRSLIESELKHRLAAIAAARPCPSCQTVNDVDADLCKKCGGKLAAASESRA